MLVDFSGNSLEVHQLLPEADEGSKIKCFREEATEILSGVHVHCLDKLGVTEGLYQFLHGIHVAEPTPPGVGGLRRNRLCGSIVHLEHEGPRELKVDLQLMVFFLP
jgi:hypothetical protein